MSSWQRGEAVIPEQLTRASWVVTPLVNESDSGTAAATVASLIETHMRSDGLRKLDGVQPGYAVTGKVSAWDYGGAIERYPTVAVKLEVRDLRNDNVIWRGAEKHTGRLVKTLSGVGDKVVSRLMSRLKKSLSSNDNPVVHTLAAADQTMPAVDTTSLMLNTNTSATTVNLGGAVQTVANLANVKANIAAGDIVGKSVAFYYGANPPTSALSQYDRVVLEPDNIAATELKQIMANGASSFAYLSVGEVGATRNWSHDIEASWVLGQNEAWGSSVMDLTATGWSDFINRRVDELVAAGYRGLFLDTMDSFLLFAKSDEQRALQEAGLEAIIVGIKQRHPELRLIANRGFEVIDRIGHQLEAIAAESLYAGWNNAEQQYLPVSTSDRQWLLGQLNLAKQNFQLDVIVIDYLPPSRREEARQVASDIVELGFLPWVANPALDYLGVGAQEVMPRDVLMIYDSAHDEAVENSNVHKMMAAPLEYFGYVPVYIDLATDELPAGELKGVVAGVVSWLHTDIERSDYQSWIQQQMNSTVPVAMVGAPGVSIDQALAAHMGVRLGNSFDFASAAAAVQDELIGFERGLSPRIDAINVNLRSESPANTVHLGFSDRDEGQLDVVITGPWGGVALDPMVVDVDPDNVDYWVIDPFRFIQLALHLRPLPMPDVTTLNGRRLWLAHIDGDALPSWAEMPGRRLGAEVIYDDILQRYEMPHSVSVVEGEMTAFPTFDDRQARMFGVAKKILNAPYVEAASHTYSHPYKWKKVGGHEKSGKYNLPIPGYTFSAERDLMGSLAFINNKLLNSEKKAQTLFWSGDALPGEEALAILDRNNVRNLNGGNTTITKAKASVSAISPMARIVGNYVQAYAPIMNENVYTNDWTGPFDGFRQVIETFQMTDKPRRMKPLNIYYHFYSGTKIASMRALDEVYEWSVKQDIHPVYASEYAELVPAFRKVGVSRYLDGTWKLNSLGPIQSLRILSDQHWPDLRQSKYLSGARQLHDGIYLHTLGDDSVLFNLTDQKPAGRYLVAANGRVQYWRSEGSSVRFRVSGHVPLELELNGTEGCSIFSKGSVIRGR
ncbi:MAG: endo alpha-1,4 polygalactosaminidase, partial [Granulosicoccus sp.]|nr:endo alpha-1,4 polygalactosaminidase [Granulosicoccus sp.]